MNLPTRQDQFIDQQIYLRDRALARGNASKTKRDLPDTSQRLCRVEVKLLQQYKEPNGQAFFQHIRQRNKN